MLSIVMSCVIKIEIQYEKSYKRTSEEAKSFLRMMWKPEDMEIRIRQSQLHSVTSHVYIRNSPLYATSFVSHKGQVYA